MLSLNEIIGTEIQVDDLSSEKLEQEKDLLERVNQVRSKWAKVMNVTSGVRSWNHHEQIYKDKALRHQKPFEDGIYDENKVPKASKHLETVTNCAAVDISDPELELTKWLKENPKVLEEAGLWCEDGNSNWCHFQNEAPNSGRRWFLP